MTEVEEDVVVGKDGWVFLNSKNNPYMAYLFGETSLSQRVVDTWHAILVDRKDKLSSQGIQYLHLFAPDKVTVYPEFYPASVDMSKGHIVTFSKYFPDLFLNPLPLFEKAKINYQLYYKTDSHWSQVGAYVCYQLICSKLGYGQRKDLLHGNRINANALFDLGAKLTPPVRECVTYIERNRDAQRVFANVLVRYKERHKIENEVGLHVGSRVVFKNKNFLHNKKVIIFGDSFSEYRPRRLTEMLSETFSEVHFCWSSGIDYRYIKDVAPDIVMTEICERFAHLPPKDDFSIDQFASSRLKKYKFESGVASTTNLTSKTKTTHTSVAYTTNELPVSKLRGPDYIIIGSMKCGTTILYDFISHHPDALAAKQKEIHYFSMHYGKGKQWYADFFSDVPGNKLTGEASPTYLDLCNGAAIPELLHSDLPGIPLIAILKDPVARAISHFNHLKFVNRVPCLQDITLDIFFSGDLCEKFESAFFPDQRSRLVRDVLWFGLYCSKLKAYKNVHGDNLLVLNGADLWNSGQAVMGKVFAHVGLSRYESSFFDLKRYVTPPSMKELSAASVRTLREFYKKDLSMLGDEFKIDFGKS